MAFIQRGALVVAFMVGCSGSEFTHGDDQSGGRSGKGGGGGHPAAVGGTGESPGAGEAGEPGTGGTGHAGSRSDRVCTPGLTQACVGAGRCAGAQACADDGLSWSRCDCSGGGGTGGEAGQPQGGDGGAAMTGGTGGSRGGNGGAGGVGGTTGGAGGTTGGAGGAGKGGSGGKSGGGGSTGGATTGGTSGSTSGGTGGAAGGTAGGSAGTGAGTGGTSGVTCESTFKVGDDGFVRMPSKSGCWSGYAFAGGDSSSTVIFPGGGTDFSKAMGKLELSGTVGSSTEANHYAGNVYFGFNIGQLAGASSAGTVAPTGTSLTITCTGCASPKMRAQLDAGPSTLWCADLTSGTAIPYTSFHKECYNAVPGAAYAKEPIQSIQIAIAGGEVDATFDVVLVEVREL